MTYEIILNCKDQRFYLKKTLKYNYKDGLEKVQFLIGRDIVR